jgi:hypothetical protein
MFESANSKHLAGRRQTARVYLTESSLGQVRPGIMDYLIDIYRNAMIEGRKEKIYRIWFKDLQLI